MVITRTIGFDFGTHQTKVCVEEKSRMETNYTFVKFKDNRGVDSFTLPSIIRINEDGTLNYGFIPDNGSGKVIRYFKQATFVGYGKIWNYHISPKYFTIWYLAYILFDIEKKYDTDFAVNFGIPSDTSNFIRLKEYAVRLLSSAYILVEKVYKNNKSAFLSDTIDTLIKKTDILPYTEENKENFAILVFPEAYACLRPLVSKGKIVDGLNLMVDIGGGTTDISFFTMEKTKATDKVKTPQIYKLMSVPMGLNYLTAAEERLNSGNLSINIDSQKQILNDRLIDYKYKLELECTSLRKELMRLFSNSTDLDTDRLSTALKNRPIIYTGGGSVFKNLRVQYSTFSDIIHVSSNMFEESSLSELRDAPQLYSVLSTAYGLCLNAKDDNISTKKLDLIFSHLGKYSEEDSYVSYTPVTRPKTSVTNQNVNVSYKSGNSSTTQPKPKKVRYTLKMQIDNLVLSMKVSDKVISEKMIRDIQSNIEGQELKDYFLHKINELKKKERKKTSLSETGTYQTLNKTSSKALIGFHEVDEFVERINVRNLLAIDAFRKKLNSFSLRDYLDRKITEKKIQPKTVVDRSLHVGRALQRRSIPRRVEPSPMPRPEIRVVNTAIKNSTKTANRITTFAEIDRLIKSWLCCNGKISDKAIKKTKRRIISPQILDYFERKISEYKQRNITYQSSKVAEIENPTHQGCNDTIIYKPTGGRQPKYGYAREYFGRIQERDRLKEDNPTNSYDSSNSLYDKDDDNESMYEGFE